MNITISGWSTRSSQAARLASSSRSALHIENSEHTNSNLLHPSDTQMSYSLICHSTCLAQQSLIPADEIKLLANKGRGRLPTSF
jgi:hypothetical protein